VSLQIVNCLQILSFLREKKKTEHKVEMRLEKEEETKNGKKENTFYSRSEHWSTILIIRE